MALNLDDDIQYLKGVGPAAAEKLNRIGIFSIRDLLYYFPRAYEDRREVKTLRDVKEGEKATFRFKILQHSRFL